MQSGGKQQLLKIKQIKWYHHYMLTNSTVKHHILKCLSQSKEIRQLEKTLQKKFTPSDGPYFRSLDDSLKELNVERQAYQGGTFVGNHVHKLLQVNACPRVYASS